MNTLVELVKVAGSIACSIGAGAVAKNIIIATTPENLPKVTKGVIWVGRNVIIMMAGAAAGKYFEARVDTIGAEIGKFMGSKS